MQVDQKNDSPNLPDAKSIQDIEQRKLNLRLYFALAILLLIGIPSSFAVIWIADDPQRVNLIIESIRQGEIFEDTIDFFQSRLDHSKEVALIGEKYNAEREWWKSSFENSDVRFIKYQEKEAIIGFFEITHSARFIELVQSVDDRPIYSVLKTMEQNGSFSVLPSIQTSSLGYELYVVVRDANGKLMTLSEIESSPNRGGLVILRSGNETTAKVVLPDEFTMYVSNNSDQMDSAMEFAFVFDSRQLDTDIQVLEEYDSPSGKILSNVADYNSLIVTYYSNNGKVMTEVLSLFQDLDEESGVVTGQRIQVKVSELLGLAQGRLTELGLDYFLAALPDPGSNSAIITPVGGDIALLKSLDKYAHLIEESTLNYGNGELAIQVNEGAFFNYGGFSGFQIPYPQRYVLASQIKKPKTSFEEISNLSNLP